MGIVHFCHHTSKPHRKHQILRRSATIRWSWDKLLVFVEFSMAFGRYLVGFQILGGHSDDGADSDRLAFLILGSDLGFLRRYWVGTVR